jgi:hypothetical protein
MVIGMPLIEGGACCVDAAAVVLIRVTQVYCAVYKHGIWCVQLV